ncbi:Mycoketide-CoA synthase (Polyketide synthase Pks12), partial [Durusdinium trenchii]
MREVGMEIPQFMDLESKSTAAASSGGGASSALALLPLEERQKKVLDSIRAAASGMGLEMDDHTPLMEAGIDSLSAVEFRNKVSSEFRSVRLPSTLMFDYPTLTALADYVSQQLLPDTVPAAATVAPTTRALAPARGAGVSEHVAVLGGACHLPGDSWSLEKFDFMLSMGVDCSVEMPHSRWDVDEYYDPDATTGLKMYVRHAAFIEGVELFAATTFGINKAEAETMDPQQRHLLEAAFEALSAGGFNKGSLMGSFGGVFVGQDKCDWNRMITGAQSGPYAATGGSSSISANRISYSLGLKGPSATMDTACSSSLVAADTAAVTLRRRRCDLAVVCGVNMLLLPQTFVACCQAQMLSKGGRCKTFDDSASGYARGEGVGSHALERLGSSSRTAIAELRGSALNQDGRSSNLTSPNGPSQQAVVLSALAEAQLNPASHACVETHGTGTALGDPMEVGALQTALANGRSGSAPLQLGAAKTNVGHLEGGAGMVGLLKLASLLSRNCLPANLHLHDLNSHIFEDIEDFPVQFQSEACPSGFPAASVSSFGFGGTNGHVVLAASAKAEKKRSTGRKAQSLSSVPKRVAFLFTGQGSQYVKMGQELYGSEPVFREAVDKCAALLDSELPKALLQVMHAETDDGLLNQTQFSQPAIFTIEYALAELWRSRGLEPCAVLGHSVGEYAAAVLAGVLSLEDACRLIALRGRLIAEKCEAEVGTMSALFAPEQDVKKAIAASKVATSDVAIAAVNGPKMTVISGRKEAVQKVAETSGATSRPLTVSHAFHSPLMQPMLDDFGAEVAKVTSFGELKVPFFSTLLGRAATSEDLSQVKYWVDHVSSAVRFTAGMEALEEAESPMVFLEIGATPTLVGMAKRFLTRKEAKWVASLDPKATPKEQEAIHKAAEACGASSTSGASADAAERPAAAPLLERQAYPWREASHPLLRRRTVRADGATVFGRQFGGHVLALLSHHIVHGEVVVPGACYLEMIVAGCTTFLGNEAWCVENLGFAKPLVLRLLPDGSLEEPTELRLVIRPDGRLEVESEIGSDPEDSIISVHVEATLVTKSGGWSANRPEQDSFNLDKLREQCPEAVDIDLMYSFGRKSGLPLQPRFRTVRHVQKGDQESFGRLEMERDGTQQGFWLGPSLIDGSFQASMALADAAVGIGTLKIPLSIRRLQPCGRKYSIAVWSYFQLIDFTDKSTVFRSWLLNDAGEALLYFDHVHLQEVRDEHIQKVLQASGRQGAEQQMLYDVLWRPTELQSKGAAQALVLGSSSALQKLNAEGVRCEELPMEEQALMSLLQSEPWSTVVLADGLLTQSAWAETPPVGALPGGELSDVAVLNRAMALTKAIAKMGVKAPLLVFATWGAQPLASEELHARRAGRPDHSGLWGFARAVRMEYPGALRLTCVDLDASKEASAWTQLNAAVSSLGDEEEVALREEAKCARLARSVVKYTGALRLNMPARGSLTGLRCVPQADTAKGSAVAPTMAQLRIRAVGLNFRDVLNVMGLYPGDPGPPGADCGATVLGLGENVKHLRLAEDVFGESPGCLSTYNTSSAALLTQKPSSWSYEEACCMPVIFVTVEEALGDLAQLKRGERVLIHAAAGGVGLVAIQYAKFIGAEVYATAGAEEKHEFLRKMGVKYITSSRNGNKFEEDMKNFLKEQGADGLDVVLNSLSHDDYIGRSLALLKPGGRFVEIGKRGIWSHKQLPGRPDVMYEKIAADTMMEKEPWRYNAYLKRLLQRVDEGALQPINMHTFEGLEKGVQALQFLQRASNIGKVVISSASRLGCDAFSMPLLSGGLGALGVVTATFLVEEGAKHLCLLSRSGQPAKDVGPQWSWLQKCAIELKVEKCDVGVEDSVVALRDSLKKGGVQLGALMHLAGVLADGVLPSLTLESLEKSYAPKVHGLLHLARHLNFQKTAPHLLFSSTSALFGSPGQANYSASNSLLDSLAAFWSSQDPTSSLWRNARSVQWGPWAEVGMAVQANTLGRAKSMGVGAVTNSQGLAIMNSILSSSNLLVGAVPVRWGKYLKSAYPQVPNFLKDFEAEAKKEAAEARAARGERESGGGAGMAALAGLSPEERLEAVRHTLRDLAREVIDSADLEADNPLMESGMDSLSGVEFRNRLQTEFDGVNLPNSMVFDYPTVTELAGYINSQLGDIPLEGAAAPSVPAEQRSSAADTFVEALNGHCVSKGIELAESRPIFLVPGAGMQAGSFRVLANRLGVPAYGLSWPPGLPRSQWPSSLQ